MKETKTNQQLCVEYYYFGTLGHYVIAVLVLHEIGEYLAVLCTTTDAAIHFSSFEKK